ncbi:MAG: SDR family oxidoreductase [Arenicellales bacterium]|nr:SDR family oxidoreductase [Arenicellales bacterium]
MNFADKKVLITGSSRGIGRATAVAFLQHGAYVAINGRTQESVDTAMENLSSNGRLVAAAGDVGTVKGCESIVRKAIDGLGGLDILVNAAGIWSPRSIEDSDEHFWDQVLDINLKGSFFCARAALPTLRKNRGNIVNIASDAGLKGLKHDTVYCASKAAVVNMTRAMALELAPNVRVNCVCPGYVDTDMVRRDYLDKAVNPELAEQEANAYAPMRRMARPGEIANAILFLASDQTGYMTGSALQIDGGSTAG